MVGAAFGAHVAFRKLETFFGTDEIERYMRAERERLGIDAAEGLA